MRRRSERQALRTLRVSEALWDRADRLARQDQQDRSDRRESRTLQVIRAWLDLRDLSRRSSPHR